MILRTRIMMIVIGMIDDSNRNDDDDHHHDMASGSEFRIFGVRIWD